jgi:hypothetical protein
MMPISCLALVTAAIAAVPPGATTVRLPDVAQLTRAVHSGDEVEIERVAARFGAVRLERLAEKGKHEERLAALRGLALVEDGWAMLPETAHLLADSDGEVAEAAALAARRVAEGLSPQRLEEAEVPRDVPARAVAELLVRADQSDLPPTVRASALATVAALRGVTRVDDGKIGKLLVDGDAQVRRAAVEALGAAALPALVGALEGDASTDVAAAAGAAICRDVPPVATPKSGAEQRAAKLSPRARDRLRALAIDEQVSLVDRLDLVGCLRVALQAPDQKVLDQLAKKGPETLRRRARALGGR